MRSIRTVVIAIGFSGSVILASVPSAIAALTPVPIARVVATPFDEAAAASELQKLIRIPDLEDYCQTDLPPEALTAADGPGRHPRARCSRHPHPRVFKPP